MAFITLLQEPHSGHWWSTVRSFTFKMSVSAVAEHQAPSAPGERVTGSIQILLCGAGVSGSLLRCPKVHLGVIGVRVLHPYTPPGDLDAPTISKIQW